MLGAGGGVGRWVDATGNNVFKQVAALHVVAHGGVGQAEERAAVRAFIGHDIIGVLLRHMQRISILRRLQTRPSAQRGQRHMPVQPERIVSVKMKVELLYGPQAVFCGRVAFCVHAHAVLHAVQRHICAYAVRTVAVFALNIMADYHIGTVAANLLHHK